VTLLDELDAKIVLALQLINPLLQRFVNIFHFKVLFLYISQVLNHFVGSFIVIRHDVLKLVKLGAVVVYYCLNVGFHHLNLFVEPYNISFDSAILALSGLVFSSLGLNVF